MEKTRKLIISTVAKTSQLVSDNCSSKLSLLKMMISQQDANQLQRALSGDDEMFEPLSLDGLRSNIVKNEETCRSNFFATTQQEPQQAQSNDDEEWIYSYEILNNNDQDDISITQEFFLPEEKADQSLVGGLAWSLDDDADMPSIQCYSENANEEPEATETTSEEEMMRNNDSMNSLSEAFEQLNRCMERTARTREMIRQSGISSSSNHSSYSEADRNDLQRSYSSIGSTCKKNNVSSGMRRSVPASGMGKSGSASSMRRNGSASSMRRNGSSSEIVARSGVAPRRMLKGGANASFSSSSPLPHNNHVRVSLSTRKRLMRDLHLEKAKNKSLVTY